MFRHILVSTDGSDISTKAVSSAVQMAKCLDAKLSILSVKEPFPYSAISEMQPVPPQEFFDTQERIASGRVTSAKGQATLAGLSADGYTVEAIHPWEAIVNQAKTLGCDLIVMASHGRRGVSALLLGSETQKVLTHCAIPVLVIK